MSQPAICSGVAGWPMPSFLPCANAGALAMSMSAIASALADLDILNLTVRLEMPGLDAVIVINRVDAADLAQRVLGRLHIAGLVDGARLQEQRLAVPLMLEVKARTGLVQHRAVQPRGLPVAAAVERDIDPRDLAAARPGQS